MQAKGVGLLLALAWLCLLYRNNHEHSRLMVAVVVAAGLLLLAILQPVTRLVVPLAAGVVHGAQLVGWVLGPLALLAGVCLVVRLLLRGLWWRWPERSARGKLGVVAGSVTLGLLVALIIRAIPLAALGATAALASSRLDLLSAP